MRVLVTGGLGFIGHHLTRRLLSEGHSVTVLDDMSRNTVDAIAGAVLCQTDLSHKIGIPRTLGAFDAVFHTAAMSRTPWCIEDPVRCHEINVTGSLNVLEATRRWNNRCRVVMSSSNVRYAAATPYKASKLMMEQYAAVYNELYGANAICLVYANTYGAGMRWDDIATFAALRRSMHENGYIEISGDGEQTRDWIHVSDVVEANMQAVKSDLPGVFDICTGTYTSLNAVSRFFHCPVRYTPDRRGDVKHIHQNPQPAMALGFAAKVKLENGIQDVLREVPGAKSASAV